jgi:transposase
MQPIVGIDIGKRTCHVCARLAPGDAPIQFSAPHAETAPRILLLLRDHAPAIIAMERTGNLANPILAALEGSPHTLAIAQHTDTLALRTMLRSRRKTDRLDANLICQMAGMMTTPETARLIAAYLTTWERVRATVKPREDVRFYQSLIRSRVALKNRIKATQSDPHRTMLHEQLSLLETQIAVHIERMTAELTPDATLLATIPTITPRRAVILIAAIGDIGNFPTRDHLVSYLGLKPPRRAQTGGKDFGRPRVTKGLDLLHTELFMLSMQVARYPAKAGPLGMTYLRLKARSGGRTALWAVRRQVIRICYGVLKSREPYRSKDT